MTNRIIKFRFWEKPGVLLSNTEGTAEFKGKMHYPGMTTLSLDYCEKPHIKNDYEVMEWSGLFDRFDSSIYEGDIVKSANDELWEVKFGEWTFDFRDEDWKMWGWHLRNLVERNYQHRETQLYHGIRLEIIGNVWESPELTKLNKE